MVFSYVLDAFGDIFDIFGGQTGNWNTTVLCHVDMMLLNHGITLCWRESSKGEHTDLVSHMVPCSLGSDFLKSWSKKLSHLGDTLSDSDQFVKPLLSQAKVIEDCRGDSCTVSWWWRIVDSDDNLNLWKDTSSRLLILAHEMDGTSTLAIQTHDLCKWLGDHHLEALIQEVSETFTIFVKVAADETLVSGIEEWIQLFLFADLSNLFPLSESWVNTCWIVGTCVQHDAGAGSGIFQILNHSIEVKTLRLLVEVTILTNLETECIEHLIVVSPSWITQVNRCWSVLLQKFTNNTKGTSSR